MSKILVQFLPNAVVKYLRIFKVFFDYTKAVLFSLGLERKAYEPHYRRFFSIESEQTFDRSDRDVCWGIAFSEYLKGELPPVRLVWAATPMPGNFGDWLSPYIIQKVTGRQIKFVNELYLRKEPHIVSLGSIATCANRHSVVLGAGISSAKDSIAQSARIVSVRGPYTEIATKHCGLKYGDPGFILSDIYKPKLVDYRTPVHPVVLVRHMNHADLNLDLSEEFDELSINAARPVDIERFIDEINSYELVITSAMHCFIACISYQIDVILVNFEGRFSKIPGDGTKYLDSLSGVNLKEIKPISISSSMDLKAILKDREKFIYRGKVRDSVKKIIHESILEAVSIYDSLDAVP